MKRLPALRLNLLFRVVYRLFPRVGKAWRTVEILLARRGYWKSLEGEMPAGGIMILDNSDSYADICSWLCEQGCCQVDFHGLGPQNDHAWCASVFFREHPAFVHRHESWPPEIYGTLPLRA